MRRHLPVLLLAAALGTSFAGTACGQTSGAQDWDARLTSFKGDVEIFAAGDDSRALRAEKGMPLQQGDRIRTGEGSSAELSLDGISLIELSALSDFSFDNVRRSRTSFKLSAGTFLAKIKSLLPGQGMQVETPAAVAAVRGTEFGVQIDPDTPDETDVGVFDEGKVEVRGRSGSPVTIIAGQETKASKDHSALRPYPLRLLIRYRRAMRVVIRKRLEEVRKSWKAMSADQRRELRGKLERRDHEQTAPDDEVKHAAPETEPRPEKEPKPEKVTPRER